MSEGCCFAECLMLIRQYVGQAESVPGAVLNIRLEVVEKSLFRLSFQRSDPRPPPETIPECASDADREAVGICSPELTNRNDRHISPSSHTSSSSKKRAVIVDDSDLEHETPQPAAGRTMYPSSSSDDMGECDKAEGRRSSRSAEAARRRARRQNLVKSKLTHSAEKKRRILQLGDFTDEDDDEPAPVPAPAQSGEEDDSDSSGSGQIVINRKGESAARETPRSRVSKRATSLQDKREEKLQLLRDRFQRKKQQQSPTPVWVPTSSAGAKRVTSEYSSGEEDVAMEGFIVDETTSSSQSEDGFIDDSGIHQTEVDEARHQLKETLDSNCKMARSGSGSVKAAFGSVLYLFLCASSDHEQFFPVSLSQSFKAFPSSERISLRKDMQVVTNVVQTLLHKFSRNSPWKPEFQGEIDTWSELRLGRCPAKRGVSCEACGHKHVAKNTIALMGFRYDSRFLVIKERKPSANVHSFKVGTTCVSRAEMYSILKHYFFALYTNCRKYLRGGSLDPSMPLDEIRALTHPESEWAEQMWRDFTRMQFRAENRRPDKSTEI